MSTSYQGAPPLVALLLLVCAVAGCCCQAYPLPDEKCCPTDARRLYCTCGEEAVRRGPCGPDRQFYGMKPTDWRPWPAGWRCQNGSFGVEEPIFSPDQPQEFIQPELELPAPGSADSTNSSTTNPFLTNGPALFPRPNSAVVNRSVAIASMAASAPEGEASTPAVSETQKNTPVKERHANPDLSPRVGQHLSNNITL